MERDGSPKRKKNTQRNGTATEQANTLVGARGDAGSNFLFAEKSLMRIALVITIGIAIAGWTRTTTVTVVSPQTAKPTNTGEGQSSCIYKSLEGRPTPANFPWIDDMMRRDHEQRKALWMNENPTTDEEQAKILSMIEEPSIHNTECIRGTKDWKDWLDTHTPLAFQNKTSRIDCYDASQVSIDCSVPWSSAKTQRAVTLLNECGFVNLVGFFPKDKMNKFKSDWEKFEQNETESKIYKYPVQGEGRYEYLMPFKPPFNTSFVYQDERMRHILWDLFGGRFKLELPTVITSKVGSKNQRWHSGNNYLFHPEERLPPYAVVVGIPLVDVPLERGPTEVCPRKNMRFYQGYSCAVKGGIAFPTDLGTIQIFDYKLLHRGPANRSDKDRPMISLVYSKLFYMNQDAIVNRGVPLFLTLNIRKYLEQWWWHPSDEKQMWQV
eukprot:TRINITY_DN9234_c0_g1_i2.p1 TRINITY_DN9234_c0_g1~~TRINITY_DN9234_c0_g1_i2.p1  ORF type:complete len:437 (+),score=103.95 TRINITY_DN9234_c0_g1_i2:274-1584(+)